MRNRHKVFATLCCLAVAGATVSILAGCAPQDAAVPSSAVSDTAPASTASAQDKSVTFPAAYFEALGEDDPVAYLTEAGYADVVANDDGSYAATVPADRYGDLVASAHDLARAIIDALPNDDSYPDVVAVDYDDQFATVTVSFGIDVLSAADALVAYVPGEAAVMYQQLAGLPVGCDVILVGSNGSELASTMFPVKASGSGEGSSAAA